MRKKDVPPTDDAWVKTDADELEALGERLKASSLSASDQKLIASLIATVLTLRSLLERRTGRLMSILRKIFGLKNREARQVGPPPRQERWRQAGRQAGWWQWP
jgi:hypothetical protein